MDAVIEASQDQRNSIALATDRYLIGSEFQNPPSSRVGSEGNDPPDFIPESEIANLSMVLGAILPVTITSWDQNAKTSMSFQFLLNPESLNWGKTNSVQMNYTRGGFVTQLWGPNQEMISATGRTAAFMVKGEGLSTISQRRSLGFKNVMALLSAYKNNGYELIDPLKDGKVTRVISRVRAVQLSFDGNSLLGHFNNFTLDNDAEHPFSMNYNFEFVVSNTSGVYKEIRGHFLPPTDPDIPDTPVLVNSVNQNNVSLPPGFIQ